MVAHSGAASGDPSSDPSAAALPAGDEREDRPTGDQTLLLIEPQAGQALADGAGVTTQVSIRPVQVVQR